MIGVPEYELVERPLIDQLQGLGWQHTEGNLDDPGATGRQNFREALLLDELRAALHGINLDPTDSPWLDEGRITQAVNALQHLGTAKPFEHGPIVYRGHAHIDPDSLGQQMAWQRRRHDPGLLRAKLRLSTIND